MIIRDADAPERIGCDRHADAPRRAAARRRSGVGRRATDGARQEALLTHAGLYKHTSLGPADRVTELGKQGGFDVTTVQGYKQDADEIDLAFLTPEYLARSTA